ncbi:MAG: polyphenol oxidase family protein, partial [Actinomycetota bacterium]|nr:polyphenol oxidase family protein [Actinomycetota bacterium]
RGPDGPSRAMVARRRALVDGPWTWLRQVHGARVVEVVRPGDHAGVEADAAVTAHTDAVLCILTADCAPISLRSPEGIRGVAHAGWKGLADGVIEATVAAMRALGAGSIEAALGPCIHPGCYEFSPADLDVVARRLGDSVRASTSVGRPALDLPNAVRVAIAGAGATLTEDAAGCTACAVDESGVPRWYSHRARADAARQALVQWGR